MVTGISQQNCCTDPGFFMALILGKKRRECRNIPRNDILNKIAARIGTQYRQNLNISTCLDAGYINDSNARKRAVMALQCYQGCRLFLYYIGLLWLQSEQGVLKINDL